MFDFLNKLLEAEGVAPHGYCLLWQPELIWTHVISDALIGAAYFSIPVAIAYFLTKRRDVQFGWVVWMFALFIMACGMTHVFAIWTLWNADYGVEAAVKLVTAAASVVTAVALWPLLPRAIALPSPAQLQLANDNLLLRIAERDTALAALEAATSERLRAEEMLRQSQKMEAVGQLTGGIAHDFNNLLTVVVGNLDRAKRLLGDGDARIGQSLDNAVEGAERAATLTSQLLAFARRQPLQPEVQNLNAVVAGMGAIFERTLGPEIELVTDFAADLWPVAVDGNQTQSALLNLAINARDAMGGGGRLTIRTRNAPGVEEGDEPDRVVLEVADTGIGMTEEVLEHAFEPFFTTKPFGQGTGLGLSQVYGFIKQSEGNIAIDSVAGQGTRIMITLPRA